MSARRSVGRPPDECPPSRVPQTSRAGSRIVGPVAMGIESAASARRVRVGWSLEALALALTIAGCGGTNDVGDAGRASDGALTADTGVSTDAGGPAADTGTLPDAFVPPASDCAALPAPTGTIVSVEPSMAAALPAMVRDAAAGTTFVLADGVYRTTGDEAARRLQIRAPGVTIRSASGHADAVVIDGEYVTLEILGVYESDFTLAEVTLTHAVDHCAHVSPPDGAANITGTRFYGVRFLDCGEQFLKVNPSGARDAFVDDGIVECSHFEMTDAGRPHVERNPGGCYTGGIDAHAARGWIVRQSTFQGIYCAGEGLAEHAIHFWAGSRDTLVERNVIVDCARGIGFGLVESGPSRDYPDDPAPGLFVGHFDGIIRNNVIFARIAYYDTGIELDQARGAEVLHNTIVEDDATATGRYSSIDARFPNTAVTIRNNLVRRLTVRDAAGTTSDHNVENVAASDFVDAAGLDAHLVAGASDAIDQGVGEGGGGRALDGEAHDRGAPDLGADDR